MGARFGGSHGKVHLLRASTVQVMPFFSQPAASVIEHFSMPLVFATFSMPRL